MWRGPQASGSRCPGVNYYLAIVSFSQLFDILHHPPQPTNSIIDTPIGRMCILSFLSVHGERNKNLSIHICPLVGGLCAGHRANCPLLQDGGKQYLLLAFIVYKNICKLKHLIFLFLPKLMTLGSHWNHLSLTLCFFNLTFFLGDESRYCTIVLTDVLNTEPLIRFT